MKTLLSTLVLMLVCITTQAGSDDPNTTLTLEGKFLEKKVVKYELYLLNADNSLQKLESHNVVGNYSVNLELGESYLIKFIAKNGSVKYLYVDAIGGSGFLIDVDFTTDKSAKLILNSGSYSLQILTTEEAESLAYVARE